MSIIFFGYYNIIIRLCIDLATNKHFSAIARVQKCSFPNVSHIGRIHLNMCIASRSIEFVCQYQCRCRISKNYNRPCPVYVLISVEQITCDLQGYTYLLYLLEIFHKQKKNSVPHSTLFFRSKWWCNFFN